MRHVLIIGGVFVLAVAGTVMLGHARAESGDGKPFSLAAIDTDQSAEEAATRKMEEQREMIETREDLKEEQITAPYERETETLKKWQNLQEQRNEVKQDAYVAPIEQEQEILKKQQQLQREREQLAYQQMIAPIEQERKQIALQMQLMRDREKLKQMQREQVPSELIRGIRPYRIGSENR
jgi:hypothetical protein